ncbi:hypothetical protein QBC39DRAFT_362152 [Podospora conica]|nr:hypothetical protein QBC39DRAFT_362152 [Schizothecium conicum]
MQLPHLLLFLSAMGALPATAASSKHKEEESQPGVHPDVILGATLAGLGLTAVIAPAIIVGPALAAVGFGPLGPIVGALAPAIQAATAPVAAGGLFATLQSAAMGGYGLGAVTGAVQLVGGAVTAVGAKVAGGGAGNGKEKKEKEEKKGWK